MIDGKETNNNLFCESDADSTIDTKLITLIVFVICNRIIDSKNLANV